MSVLQADSSQSNMHQSSSIEHYEVTSGHEGGRVSGEGSNGKCLEQPAAASRPIACIRAPCLKKSNGMQASTSIHSPGFQSHSPSYFSQASNSDCGSDGMPFGSFMAPRSLVVAIPKRQVHFDAAPPEAGITHSRDQYDRRPIECTQGGSALDLSLPPRGAHAQYADGETNDAVCSEEDEERIKPGSPASRLKGLCKWSQLKNGAIVGSKESALSSAPTVPTSPSEGFNPCSVPVHGIRSFGGLAGQSGVLSDKVSGADSGGAHRSSLEEESDEQASLGGAYSLNESSDEPYEYHTRDDAFRRAVQAVLSKSPNATPMPSPRVRPRWESVTSYFEENQAQTPPSARTDMQPTEMSQEEGVTKDEDTPSSHCPKETASSSASSGPHCIESKGGQCSPDLHTAASTSTAQAPLQHPPHLSVAAWFKVNDSACDGASSSGTTSSHPSSSPMSSRCSSSDDWSGSQRDETFGAAFAEEVERRMSLNPDNLRLVSASPSASTSTSSRIEREFDSEVDQEHTTTSSSSGVGGAGWMSSCCTSPELVAMDTGGKSSPSLAGKNVSTTGSSESEVGSEDSQPNRGFRSGDRAQSLHLEGASKSFSDERGRLGEFSHRVPPEGFKSASCPTSGTCSPQVVSADELGLKDSEVAAAASFFFRNSSVSYKALVGSGSCRNAKTRKARRSASSCSPRDSDSESNCAQGNAGINTRRCPRPNAAPRSRSMSAVAGDHGPKVKRTSSLCQGYSFVDSIEDEGALGGF